MDSRLPNLFIIGAAKAGTTTVYNALGQHPDVYLPLIKEPSFFSRDSDYQKGLDWYVDNMYRRAGSFRVRVDASTQYLFWGEKVAPRIKNAYGDAEIKYISIFRDPVERAYSWYWNAVAEEKEDLPFSQAMDLEGQRYASWEPQLRERGVQEFGYYRGGCYAANLRPFLGLFPRDRFLFLLSEDLATDFRGTFDRIFRFLELPARAVKRLHANRSAQPVSRRLRNFLKRPTGLLPALVRPLYRSAPYAMRYSLKRSVLDATMRPVAYPPMDAQVARGLRERYADEVRALAKIIGRDLSAWLPQ